MPAHIHPAILEPNIEYPYYIDEFVFDDDPLLTEQKRNANENRCGSGIFQLTRQGDIQVTIHDIILGKNIPDFPANTDHKP